MTRKVLWTSSRNLADRKVQDQKIWIAGLRQVLVLYLGEQLLNKIHLGQIRLQEEEEWDLGEECQEEDQEVDLEEEWQEEVQDLLRQHFLSHQCQRLHQLQLQFRLQRNKNK